MEKGEKKRKWIAELVCLLMTGFVFMLTACGETELPSEKKVKVYYVSGDETGVEIHEYERPTGSSEDQIRILLAYLSATPGNLRYKAYKALSATAEVLTRAAIVKTITQADNVTRVMITVEGNALYDSAGDQVGWMTADQFIRNDGSEINSYEKVRVKLYFANESGDKLIAAYREKFYSTNISLERFVVEEILAGPSGRIAGLYPTVHSDTKILSVRSKDGICYVNLDSNFLTAVNNVTSEVAIYSIVNSLSELPHIHHVQILVNGALPPSFTISSFEKNTKLVTTLEQNAEEASRESSQEGQDEKSEKKETGK